MNSSDVLGKIVIYTEDQSIEEILNSRKRKLLQKGDRSPNDDYSKIKFLTFGAASLQRADLSL